MALSKGKQIIAQRMGTGLYNCYAGLLLPENWNKSEEGSALLRSSDIREHLIANEFAGWSSDATDLIKHSNGSFRAWPLYTLPPEAMSWKSVPGITLIGDAAHLSLPNGDGVNIALYDAFQLTNEIVECGLENLDQAVRKYEDKMFPRAIHHIEDGIKMGQNFSAPDAPVGFRRWLVELGAIKA